MLLTAKEDYPDPGKRCVSATFIHKIVVFFQCGMIPGVRELRSHSVMAHTLGALCVGR